MNEETNKYKLSATTMALIGSVALFYDLVQALFDLLHFIPFLGNLLASVFTAIISVIAWMTFYFWFKLHGIHFNTAKRALTLGGGFLIELIPVLNILPAWTLAVVLIFLTTKVPIIKKVSDVGQATKGKGV